MERALGIHAFAVLASTCAGPASAQTLAETRAAVEIMVASAYDCSDYLQRPEVLTEWQDRGRQMLGEAGMAAGETDAFLTEIVETAKAQPATEMQQQASCEVVNIPTIKVE